MVILIKYLGSLARAMSATPFHDLILGRFGSAIVF